MLSPEILSRNLEALTRAQGTCPALGALRDSMRVAITGGHVNVELRLDDGEWRPIDTPDAAHARWLGEGGTGRTQMILVGAGLGYALERALELGVQKMVAVEPDPGVATLLLSRRDWQPLFANGRLRLLTGPDYRGAADVARFLDGLSEIPIVSHPLRTAIEPDAYARARAVAERVAANAKNNGHARRRFAGPYLLQTLTNLPAIAREGSVQALAGAFAGIPAVVAGAGPSLDDNIPALRTLADRAIIVATDTTLGPLLKGGVRPHLVVGVDSSALNAQHLTTPDGSEDVMLAAEGSLHPSVYERFGGRIFSFRISNHDPWPWFRATGIDRPEVRTWGSVLTSAFDLACVMGCDPIVFVGADLAYTGMRPYCRGTIYDAQWQEWIDKGCTWEQLMEDYFSRQPEVYQDDVRGERTRTAPNLVSFRDWLVERITSLVSKTVINATGAGILHGGRIQQGSLEAALGGRAGQTGIRATLREKHAASIARREDLAAMNELLRKIRSGRKSAPVKRWIDFTAGTVTERDILAALPASLW